MALDEATRSRIAAAIERARIALHNLETQGPTANGVQMKALVDAMQEAKEDVRIAHLDPLVLKQYISDSKHQLDEIEKDVKSRDAKAEQALTVDGERVRPSHSKALEDFDVNTTRMARTVQGIGKSDPNVKR